jgi:hypothetical protein
VFIQQRSAIDREQLIDGQKHALFQIAKLVFIDIANGGFLAIDAGVSVVLGETSASGPRTSRLGVHEVPSYRNFVAIIRR